MPAGDQIDCYLSCNVRINKGELKKYIYIMLLEELVRSYHVNGLETHTMSIMLNQIYMCS